MFVQCLIDSGLAIGAAQYLWHHHLDNPRIVWEDNFTPYLGFTYSDSQVKSAIDDKGSLVNTKKQPKQKLRSY